MKRRLMLTLVASALAVLLAASASAEAGPIMKSSCPDGFGEAFVTMPGTGADHNGDGVVCLKGTPSGHIVVVDNHPVRIKK